MKDPAMQNHDNNKTNTFQDNGYEIELLAALLC